MQFPSSPISHLIIESLAQHGKANAKMLVRDIQSVIPSITLQGVYKQLKTLSTKGIIYKSHSEYILSLHWLEHINNLHSTALNNILEHHKCDDFYQRLKKEDYIEQTYNSIQDFRFFFLPFKQKMMNIYQENIQYSVYYHNHPLDRLECFEKEAYREMDYCKIFRKFDCKWDKYFLKKLNDNLGIDIYVSNYYFPKEIMVMNDVIIEIDSHPKSIENREQIINSYDPEKVENSILIDHLEKKYPLKVRLCHSEKRAKHLHTFIRNLEKTKP